MNSDRVPAGSAGLRCRTKRLTNPLRSLKSYSVKKDPLDSKVVARTSNSSWGIVRRSSSAAAPELGAHGVLTVDSEYPASFGETMNGVPPGDIGVILTRPATTN